MPHVYPANSKGMKCVVVEARLRELGPIAWQVRVDFARVNQLEVRREADLAATAGNLRTPPVK